MTLHWRIAAGLNCAAGVIVAVLMLGHIAAVLLARVRGGEADWVSGEGHAYLFGIPWDFRIYALLLFGAMGAASAVLCVRSAVGMFAGDAGALRGGVRGSLIMMGVFAPVIPLQSIALGLTMLAAMNAAVLLTCVKSKRTARRLAASRS